MTELLADSDVDPSLFYFDREPDGYLLPIELELARRLPFLDKSPPFVNFGKPQRRAEAMMAIVRQYEHYPVIENTVGKLYGYGREGSRHELHETVLHKVRADARAHRQLPHDTATIRKYFQYIERGLATCVGLEGRAPSPPEEKRLLDLTLAYKAVTLSSLPVALMYLKKHHMVDRERGQVPEEDITHDAYKGLLDAVQRYDYTQGVSFWNFATPWIRSAVQTGFRTQRSNIPLRHEEEQQWLKLREAYLVLLNSGPDEITPPILAERARLNKEEVIALIGHSLRRSTSLDQRLQLPHNPFDDWVVGDRIKDRPLTQSPESDSASLAHLLLLSLIEKAGLKPGVLTIISLRFGVRFDQLAGTRIGKQSTPYEDVFAQVGGIMDPTNSEIAQACGLSMSSVEKHASFGMRALRKAVQG